QEKTGARGRNERPKRGEIEWNSVPSVMKSLFYPKFPGKRGLIEVPKSGATTHGDGLFPT
ncbi:hypothetical protein, partial [Tepidiphilus thermophilus]|uniref:hypothetical protein n=1 Tax=Tepidiphilus thermophilus TaxID=876478 RepID=UPI001C400E16